MVHEHVTDYPNPLYFNFTNVGKFITIARVDVDELKGG